MRQYMYSRSGAALTTALMLITFLLGIGSPQAEAKPKSSSLSVVPTINSITVQNGQLVASGTATAVIKGRTYTAPFSDVPVNVSLAPNQTPGAACPILDLQLGPITLNLLGLLVETSPICLTVTANPGGGLLGDLLCSVANLLNGGLNLGQILAGQGVGGLPGLTTAQINSLLSGLTNLFNTALLNLLDAVITGIQELQGRTCAILHLELGPIDLTLLGLEVVLDNCQGGPVTVDITAVRGGLLGNLLCGLLRGGLLGPGATLGDILGLLLGLPPL